MFIGMYGPVVTVERPVLGGVVCPLEGCGRSPGVLGKISMWFGSLTKEKMEIICLEL